jgi:hypothetical protein
VHCGSIAGSGEGQAAGVIVTGGSKCDFSLKASALTRGGVNSLALVQENP